MADEIAVSFSCQQCQQPLVLDDSFNNLSEHILAEITLPQHTPHDIDLNSQVSFDHFAQPFRLSDSGNGTNDFMVIPDSSEGLSHTFKIQAALFDTLSGNSNVDHPLCDECADRLLDMLDEEIRLTEKDYADYTRYLNKLKKDPYEPRLKDLERELKECRSEEKKLLLQLEELKKEEAATLEAISLQEQKRDRLSQDDEQYWRRYTSYRRDLMYTDDEYRSLECQIAYTQDQLEKLKSTNVFNATFHIWYAGHFGTINNFKLGRLPADPVDWSQINAAWGQTALLLSALARKLNLTFDRYKLVPYGNHSYIEDLREQKELPLYGSGGIKFLWDTKFDSGMVAFLDCLQQFKEKVEQGDSGDRKFRLPYGMSKGKIEEASTNTNYSIKIQFNSEEQWTKALKFMLTNLKWSLAWVTAQFDHQLPADE